MIRRRGLGDDRGAVVAEFAVALPAVIVVVLMAVGALSAAGRQVRLQDAAADAARLAARGESDTRVLSAVAAVGEGARAGIGHRGDLVCVTASWSSTWPLGSLAATSCALDGGL